MVDLFNIFYFLHKLFLSKNIIETSSYWTNGQKRDRPKTLNVNFINNSINEVIAFGTTTK